GPPAGARAGQRPPPGSSRPAAGHSPRRPSGTWQRLLHGEPALLHVQLGLEEPDLLQAGDQPADGLLVVQLAPQGGDPLGQPRLARPAACQARPPLPPPPPPPPLAPPLPPRPLPRLLPLGRVVLRPRLLAQGRRPVQGGVDLPAALGLLLRPVAFGLSLPH